MKATGRLGADYLGGGQTHFLVWAPLAERVAVHIVSPEERTVPLASGSSGYHEGVVGNVGPGSLYFYDLDGVKERPDPASRAQPRGVRGPSMVIDPSFAWEDADWHGLPLADYVAYELHVGAFTPEGTFDAVIPFLEGLKALGITAVELMPVAQFPGTRNWGYDGVFPYAVQDSYGGADGLRRLVNACHRQGMALVLDVVYNHFGPEGNYTSDFGPYFTDRYKTPWGAALNFDGPYSDEVRRFFIENAVYWLNDFHIDALRLDALHAILDISSCPFIEELAASFQKEVERESRHAYLIGESAANDARLIRERKLGGYGLDAQWNDDFHHALHVLLTGEQTGYYQDFGQVQQLAKAFREGFVYSGQYSAYRQRRHGVSSADLPADRFVVFAQNHDQVGNRALGDRLSTIVSFEALKLAAGVVMLSPFMPLIFMGEEYGETAPFPYFVSHSDAALVEAVRKGRREEFAAFQWQGKLPDPQSEATFMMTKLDRDLMAKEGHATLLRFYRELIALRKKVPALASLSKKTLQVQGSEENRTLFVRRWKDSNEALAIFSFVDKCLSVNVPVPEGKWRKRLDSSETRWLGGGSTVPDLITSAGEVTLNLCPRSFVLFVKEG